MPEPFASLSDLETRWRELSDGEVPRALELLNEASAMIRTERPDIDDAIAEGDMDPVLPRGVVCRIVKRSMSSGSDIEGVSSANDMAGPFGLNLTYANPSGDLYLTKQERKLLGIRRQRAFSVDTLPPRPAEDDPL